MPTIVIKLKVGPGHLHPAVPGTWSSSNVYTSSKIRKDRYFYCVIFGNVGLNMQCLQFSNELLFKSNSSLRSELLIKVLPTNLPPNLLMIRYLAILLLRSGLLSPLNTFMSWFEIGFVILLSPFAGLRVKPLAGLLPPLLSPLAHPCSPPCSPPCWLLPPTHNKMTDTDARLLLLATLMQHSLTLLMRLGHLLLVTHRGVLKQ